MGESDETQTLLDDHLVVVLGCGKMGTALASGLVEGGGVAPDQLACVDRHPERAGELASATGGEALAPEAAYSWGRERPERRLFVAAVKPGDLRGALEAGQGDFEEDDTVVSIAAGVPLEDIRNWAGSTPDVVRAMPNTPALVEQGMTGVCGDGDADMQVVEALFSGVGRVVRLDNESDFDALTAVSGSGPAYVFTAIEALADGAVSRGMSRETAIRLATETLAGSAALAREDEAHTAELKDKVTSPGGTTIAGLTKLEEKGFRDALISAVQTAADRSREMQNDLDTDE